MKTLLTLLTVFLFASNVAFAQEKLTLYYDADGKGLDTKKKAVFYRLANFDDMNRPTGIVHDFYMNDKPLAEGQLANLDKFDHNKSRWKGSVTTYSDKGKLSGHWNYDENGFLDGTQTLLNADGRKEQELEYQHGNPAKDHYLFYDKKGNAIRYSYLTHLPMTLSTTDKDIVPFSNRQTIFEDGQRMQFYSLDGVTVSVKLSTKKLYGNYYEAFITIENGSNPQFDFDPAGITASLESGGVAQEGEVLTYDDYMKKVKRRQGLATAFTALVETANVASSAYSSSTTTVSAKTSSGRTATLKAKTTSYDGAAASAAAQQAGNDLNQMAGQQSAAKQTISEGYLKVNTIFPNSRIVGFVNIKHLDADHIYLNIPVNGKVYHFEF